LPSLLGSIGDSLSEAFDVSPTLPHTTPYPANSWVVGWAKHDGVFSVRERFEALGASLTVVDAATPSKKMNDAARQASQIVAAARKLKPGQTAFVTLELGTNDLCYEPKTNAAAFEAQLEAAAQVLEGLPPGSRILMLSVPDFIHVHDLIQADRATRDYFARSDNVTRCAPFVGAKSSISLQDGAELLASYDASIVKVCGEIETTYGPSDALHCTSDPAGLAEEDFTIDDISNADHFHFSYSGQNKMAEAAWQAMPWAALELPAGAKAWAPGSTPGRAPDPAPAGVLAVPVTLAGFLRGRHGRARRRLRLES
jgi:lysophospholipase L1-like esterase